MNDNIRTLLIAEQAEINLWARVVNQIYFTWYGVFLGLSGAALAWVVPGFQNTKYIGGLSMAAFMFALWSVMGAIVGMCMLVYARKCHDRICYILNELTSTDTTERKIQSPIPTFVANVAYIGTTIALLSLFFIWSWIFSKTIA